MTDAETLYDLLAEYEAAVDRGESPTPEAVCAKRPDLLPAFRERLAALGGFDQAFGVGGTVPESAPPTAPGPLVLGGHAVVAELGRGGMGVVYLARQPGLGRLVALKLLHAGATASPVERARFRLEAEAVARLRHPNVVGVIQVGEHDGQPFLTLEYCPGGSLAARLKEHGRFAPRAAAELVRALAGAVQAAHDAGVVHRDLKPGNVLFDERGVPRVADFGLAKDLAEAGPSLTGDRVVGTPAYMAPEQAAGRNRDVGPLADVWALGGILYALLTGEPPFRGPSHLETLRLVLSADPAPPRQANRSVPRDLETICLKCLEKVPARRYASAQELADDLGRFLDGEPVRARPVGRLGRAWRFAKRYPVQVGLALAVVVSLAVGAAVATGYAWEADRQAGDAFRLAGEKGALAEANGKLAEDRRLALEAEQAERYRLATYLYAQQLDRLVADWRQGERLAALRQRLDACAAEMRGWEYGLLRAAFADAGPPYPGQDGSLSALAIDPAGALLAAGGGAVPVVPVKAGSVRLHDLASGALLRTIADLPGRPRTLRFRDDGQRLLVATPAGPPRLYDPATGREVARFAGAMGHLPSAAFLPGGDVVAVGVAGVERGEPYGEVVRWPADGGEPVFRVAQGLGCTAVAVARAGDVLYVAEDVGDGKAEVVVRDAATGRELRRWGHQRQGVGQLVLSPDGAVLAAGTFAADRDPFLALDGEVVGWEVATGRQTYRLGAARGTLLATPAGLLVAGVGDVRLFDWRTGDPRPLDPAALPPGARPAPVFTDGHSPIAAPHPSGAALVVGSANRPDAVRVDLVRRLPGRRFERSHAMPIEDRFDRLAAPLADRRHVVLPDGNREQGVYDAATGAWRRDLEPVDRAAPQPVPWVAVHPDGKTLAVVAGGPSEKTGGAVWLVEGETGRRLRRLPLPAGPLAWSPDGGRLVASPAGGLAVWGLAEERLLFSRPQVAVPLAAVRPSAAFSSDGRRLVFHVEPDVVRVCDARTGAAEATIRVETFSPSPVGFLAGGKEVVGLVGKVLVTWDAETGREVRRLTPTELSRGAWALDGPRGRLAAAVSAPPRVEFRDVATGQVTRLGEALADAPTHVATAAFSPDGGRLLGATWSQTWSPDLQDHVVRREGVFWDAATGRIVARLEGGPFPDLGRPAFAPDGRTVWVPLGPGEVGRWDATTGKRLGGVAGFTGAVRTRVEKLTPEAGGRLAGLVGGDLVVWDAATGRHRVLGDVGREAALAVSPDGARVAVGRTVDLRQPGELTLRDAVTGEVSWRVAGVDPGVARVAFSRDGRFLVAATGPNSTQAGHLEVRDPATGNVLQRFAVPDDGAVALAWTPEPHVVLCPDRAGGLHRVDLAAGRVEKVALAVPLTGRALALSADATRLFASDGVTLTVWNWKSRLPVVALPVGTPQRTPTLDVRLWLAPDGRSLIHSSPSGTVVFAVPEPE